MNESPTRRRGALALLAAAMTIQALAPLCAAVPQTMSYQGRVTIKGQNFDGEAYFKFSLVDGGVDQSTPAKATAEVNGDGVVREIHVTNQGSGYTSPPTVSIRGTGERAEAVAVMEGDHVASITVTETGNGYSQITPTEVIIAPPPPNIAVTTYWSHDGTGSNGLEPESFVALPVRKGLYSVILGDQPAMQVLPASVFNHDDVRLRVWFSSNREGPYTLLTPDQRIAAVGYALVADRVKPGAITAEMMSTDAIGMAQLTPEVRQALLSLQAWQSTQLPLVTSPPAADAAVEYSFTYQITASGSPTGFSATGLPPNWTVNTTTGLISATPDTTGTFTFNVSATNVAGTGPPRQVTVTVTGAVYVDYATGVDGNSGTQALPVKTLTQGLAISASGPVRRAVLVSAAAQPLAVPLQLPEGARIKGGWDRAAGWIRTGARTPLTYSPPAGPDTEAAVTADSLTKPVLLDGFTITSGITSGTGRNSIGVRVRNCSQTITLSGNTIIAGSGGAGQAGANGAAGNEGAGGFIALSGRGPGYPAGIAFPPAPGSYVNPTYLTGCGGSPFEYGSVPQYQGFKGFANSSTGAAGTGGTAGFPFAGNGGAGGPGDPGFPGADGTATAGLHLSSTFLASYGGAGLAGSTGENGGSGGGGGGVTNTNNYGGGGGGGGKGGDGGKGGGGGQGGGGSFAVMVIHSPVSVLNCALITGSGGIGGQGGRGGTGGAGGAGGAGHVTPANGQFNSGDGGNGGAGGRGGGGGGGAGGQGGPSIGIIASVGSTVTETGNIYALGSAGAGGTGGLPGGDRFDPAPSGQAGVRQAVLTGAQP